MNKTELVDAIAKETGLSKKDSEKAVKAFTDTVSKELKKKGFYNYENYQGVRLLQGPFAGYKEVQLFIADYENVVFNVAAYIDMTDSWNSTKLSYENLKSSLRRKYDVEPVVEEYFPGIVREGSGYEYRAFDEGTARYSSTFYLDNGFISVSIVHFSASSNYQLLISYYDLQNFQRRNSMADDDL